MSALRTRLLQAAIPLVREHGFTRQALANSVLHLQAESRSEPLPDTAVTTLFGEGDNARRTLIDAWLEKGRIQMKSSATSLTPDLKEVLRSRLGYNEPVLSLLPEAFALLASPQNGLPPLDVRPALRHATSVANDACIAIRDESLGPSWYTQRATLATIYTAAELHQLTSPGTAHAFLDSIFDTAASLRTAASEAELYSQYVVKSWAALVRSSGVL
ncbi:uncharacterized protein STEHIDRAFT_91612 [Stereum hirsutum FP-91666 SS1]|uniref:uncharacterized protein n=1 Tax=Stereum hirsutum (strain FP-91666) TaxID=721885 RepID=UPI00044104F1|nr:uncharacterized protein STEHIDRAFT_91612 [Stereum hirsutum FP-91666 SS1]EIM91476.1 hypothetical protein STEHIDRAFT_91612 [Stereum hirsutum FP-91666 SS1]